MVCEAWGAVPEGDDQAVSKVFVVISETMPVNGTYPASALEGLYTDEDSAWSHLYTIAVGDGNEDSFADSDTVYYAKHDPEKYEYIEYRIEEHEVKA